MFTYDPMIEDLSEFQGNYGRVSSLDELKTLIEKLSTEGGPVAFDVETGYTGPDKKKASLDVYYPHQFITGFSLTNDVGWARYIPVKHDFSHNLNPNEVWPLVKPLLEESTLVCHNWVFEARNLRELDTKGDGPRIDLDWRKAHDTILQSYVLSETRLHGLKELTGVRYNYDQAHLEDLFDKTPTQQQKDALRFNTFDVNPAVVNYVCDDVCWSLRLDRDLRARCERDRKTVYGLEREISGILLDMAETGIAVDWDGIGHDLGRFDFFYQQMESRTRRLFEEASGRDLTALNFRSAIQMRQLLFTDMGLRSTRMTKPNASGEQSLSTDETALEALRHQHPAIEQLLKYRQVKKMGEWFENWSQLRTSVDERVHPSLNQIRVQSGRFASDSPNVQNITKKWWFSLVERDPEQFPPGKVGDAAYEAHVRAVGTNGIDYWAGNARDFLIASPGYSLLTFDYQAAEMRVLAGITKEPYLIKAFQEGSDVHKVAASLAFRVPLDEVTPEQRQRAKGVQFGLVYGQSAQASPTGSGISKDEAQAIMDQYFSAFSKVGEWFAKVKRDGRRDGYVTSWLGRRSTIWELQSDNKAITSKADRMFVNIPVQGGAADYCKLAMVKVKRELIRLGWWQTSVRLLMNQHDSLIFEVSDDLALTEVRDILQPLVSFPLPGVFPDLPPMEVDWEHGHRWGSVIPITEEEPAAEVSPAAVVFTEVEFPVEMVLRFAEKPSVPQARELISVLKNFPGDRTVLFAVDDREMPCKVTVAPSPRVSAALVRFGCQVELRQIA